MRGYAWGAVLWTLLAGCGASSPTLPVPPKQAINDTLIVPKTRIGPAALGMTEANLLDWLGTPDKTISDGSHRIEYVYERRGLMIGFNRGRAIFVQALDNRYATKDGISVGSPELKVRATWGQPTKSKSRAGGDTFWHWHCFANDLRVLVQDGTVRDITVDARGCSV